MVPITKGKDIISTSHVCLFCKLESKENGGKKAFLEKVTHQSYIPIRQTSLCCSITERMKIIIRNHVCLF